MVFRTRPPSGCSLQDPEVGFKGVEFWLDVDNQNKIITLFVLGAWGRDDTWDVINAGHRRIPWNLQAEAHSGFLGQANDLLCSEHSVYKKSMVELIDDFQSEGFKFLYSGHSMGGAVAILLADRHEKVYGVIPVCEVFAAPWCIGNWAFVDSMCVPVVNHLVGADPIILTSLVVWLGMEYHKVIRHESPNPGRWWNRMFEDHHSKSYIGIEYTLI